MEIYEVLLIFTLSVVTMSEGFYEPVTYPNIKTVVPDTLNQLRKALCNNMSRGRCTDREPLRIIINKPFNFINSEKSKTETGCFHRTYPSICLIKGQLQLNVAHQCNGLEPTQVTYDVAGKNGLKVGSNKIIEGQNGGALIGKGLQFWDVENVEVRNLKIRDINPKVIWTGDALDIKNSKNILIDGCYLKNIGRQMIVTSSGPNTGILVKNTVFDGRTLYSSHCNGNHYWLWLFLGTYDQIALQNNVVFNTNGRGPHVLAQNNSKTIVYLLQNILYNIADLGLIDLEDFRSSILAEGNIIYNVSEVVYECQGHVFVPQNKKDAMKCQPFLGRKCLINTIVKSNKIWSKDSDTVLEDFKGVNNWLPKPISMKHFTTNLRYIPEEVRELLNQGTVFSDI